MRLNSKGYSFFHILILIFSYGIVGVASDERPKKQNVIFMVSDGLGPSGMTLARTFKQKRDSLPYGHLLNLDHHLVGTSRTVANGKLITDSAAGATAFSCALKTDNGAIGVDPEDIPCGTILEALKLKGYRTGLVVTTFITDATPASFSAHAVHRSQQSLIAKQQLGENPLGPTVDLMLGGGRCYFLPNNNTGGCREDQRNLIQEAISRNYTYVGDRASFDALEKGEKVKLPLLGLLASKDLPFDIDRNPNNHPSLAEQVKTALTALRKATEDSDSGFFLLIEGSRIDHAGHQNDPAAHVREVLAYDQAVKEVVDFIDSEEVPTIMISTSDHETGGLSVARQVNPKKPGYSWWPEILINTTHSGEYLSKKVAKTIFSSKYDAPGFHRFIRDEVFEKGLGITDYTDKDVQSVFTLATSPTKLSKFINNMVSKRSQTGWTTYGHSAVDVNVYAYSNSDYMNHLIYDRDGLLGNHENVEIGDFLETLTGANLTDVTKILRKNHTSISRV